LGGMLGVVRLKNPGFEQLILMHRPPSNPSLQRTAGRSDASRKIMKTPPPQFKLALASGR
jgi:hypothetical protein